MKNLKRTQDKADVYSVRQIALAIKAIDNFRNAKEYVISNVNVKRIDKARKELINTLFACGYELEARTYKAIKSTNYFRALIK